MRHFGARVNDRFALDGLRTVTVENRTLRVTFLADRGCDIVEFLYKPKDVDFLWRSPESQRRRPFVPTTNATSPFTDHYRGGWQELFPHASTPSRCAGAELGFHGEVWGLPWDYTIDRDEPDEVRVMFRVRTLRTPFLLERTVSLGADRPLLRLHERVVNEGASELEFMWGHHPAFGPPFLDENCILDAPAGRVRIGDSFHEWPVDESGFDHSRLVRQKADREIMKYLHDLREGWVALTQPRLNVGVGLVFDSGVFPFVWLWHEFRYTEGYPWYGRAWVIGVEPQSSLPGARESGGRLLKLAGGESLETDVLAVAYEASAVRRIAPDGTVEPRS